MPLQVQRRRLDGVCNAAILWCVLAVLYLPCHIYLPFYAEYLLRYTDVISDELRKEALDLVEKIKSTPETAREAKARDDASEYLGLNHLPVLEVLPEDFVNFQSVRRLLALPADAANPLLSPDVWRAEIPAFLYDLEQYGRDMRASLMHKQFEGIGTLTRGVFVPDCTPPKPSALTKAPIPLTDMPERQFQDSRATRFLEDARVLFVPAHITGSDWVVPWTKALDGERIRGHATIDEVLKNTQFCLTSWEVAADLLRALEPQLPASSRHETQDGQPIWFHRHLNDMRFVCECCPQELRKALTWPQLVSFSVTPPFRYPHRRL